MSDELVIVERGTSDEVMDLQKAQEVGETLCKQYPGHPWMVTFQAHALCVKHMDICEAVRTTLGKDGFGFLLPNLRSHTAKRLARDAMLAGGQMLEAFGMARGRYDEDKPPVVPAGWTRQQRVWH